MSDSIGDRARQFIKDPPRPSLTGVKGLSRGSHCSSFGYCDIFRTPSSRAAESCALCKKTKVSTPRCSQTEISKVAHGSKSRNRGCFCLSATMLSTLPVSIRPAFDGQSRFSWSRIVCELRPSGDIAALRDHDSNLELEHLAGQHGGARRMAQSTALARAVGVDPSCLRWSILTARGLLRVMR